MTKISSQKITQMKNYIVVLFFLLPCISYGNDWKLDDQIKGALSEVNRIRNEAGLDSVKISKELSIGCYNHARYLVLNRESPKVKGLNAHKEFPELEGYSESGMKAGKRSVIHYVKPEKSVAGWEASFYHRIPLLQPNLKEIGIAYYEIEGYRTVSLIDCISGVRGSSNKDVVFYPANNQVSIPVKMGAENPHPVGIQGDYGFPITIYFTKRQTVKDVRFQMTTKDGEIIDCHLSTPESPATSFTQWNSICIIPFEPLESDKIYHVKIIAKVNDEDFKKIIEFQTKPDQ